MDSDFIEQQESILDEIRVCGENISSILIETAMMIRESGRYDADANFRLLENAITQDYKQSSLFIDENLISSIRNNILK